MPAVCTQDAGPAGACNRLAACCALQTDQVSQVQCNTLYQTLSPAGDALCQELVPSFCR
ncbi:MAG TPA: hypothetical protein VI299_26160 [Polyangiales bacterium]